MVNQLGKKLQNEGGSSWFIGVGLSSYMLCGSFP